MKQRYLILAITSLLCLQCSTGKKITYDIPDDFPKERKKQILEAAEKGKEIYKTHCAECHGIFTKGKDKIPNFSQVQLDNYSARFIGRDPKNHAVTREMSMEQLNQVLTFLRYKKMSVKDTTAGNK